LGKGALLLRSDNFEAAMEAVPDMTMADLVPI
jgi:hypothetical protein